jgi:hypothetical protein
METVAQVCTVLRAVLTTGADAAAWRTGFLRQPQASLSELACTAAQLGAPVSPQALDQRLGADRRAASSRCSTRRRRRSLPPSPPPSAARPIRGGGGAR